MLFLHFTVWMILPHCVRFTLIPSAYIYKIGEKHVTLWPGLFMYVELCFHLLSFYFWWKGFLYFFLSRFTGDDVFQIESEEKSVLDVCFFLMRDNLAVQGVLACQLLVSTHSSTRYSKCNASGDSLSPEHYFFTLYCFIHDTGLEDCWVSHLRAFVVLILSLSLLPFGDSKSSAGS